jgi:hypothetical protein
MHPITTTTHSNNAPEPTFTPLNVTDAERLAREIVAKYRSAPEGR